MNMIATNLSREDLLAWANNSPAFYRLSLERISTVFLAQAYSFEINRVFNTFHLTQPIMALEGLSSSDTTPQEDQFLHPPLAGLYKKHFYSDYFIPKNLSNFIRSKAGCRFFNQVYDEAILTSESEYIDEAFIRYLSHRVVFDPIKMKQASKSFTGEWIVFNKYEGKHYYLAIAFHNETNDEIYRRVALASEFDDFPFRL